MYIYIYRYTHVRVLYILIQAHSIEQVRDMQKLTWDHFVTCCQVGLSTLKLVAVCVVYHKTRCTLSIHSLCRLHFSVETSQMHNQITTGDVTTSSTYVEQISGARLHRYFWGLRFVMAANHADEVSGIAANVCVVESHATCYTFPNIASKEEVKVVFQKDRL